MGAEKLALETTIKDTLMQFSNKRGIEVVQIWGHIGEAICEYAGEKNIDLLVVGSRGRSGFARMLLGSISTQVVQHSPCPVTVVH